MSRRTRATALSTGAALAAALLALPASPAAAADLAGSHTWLVSADGDALPGLLADLRRDGVRVERTLPAAGTAVVRGSAALPHELSDDPRVAGVHRDGTARVHTTYDPKTDVNSLYNTAVVVGARAAWTDTKRPTTGSGVDVAVLDTGVSPVAGLDAPGKVVHGPDLSFDSQSDDTRHLDGFGHGTAMAGIIAGRDAGASPTEAGTGAFLGIAPDARIVSVKVADAWGNADVSQVIAGIDWVVQHRKSHGLNIRVLNLSLGLPSGQGYGTDPLMHAAEQAWHKGIVVVASAGNDGTGTGQLLSPARDPYVIAVGANDSLGTHITDDDVIPSFSSRGDGVRNPDLVAPGRSVPSLRVPGSYLDQQHGATAVVGERFFRGSGTSQAAAVVSGAAALLLAQEPSYTPEDVKHLLKAGARPLPAADLQAQGRGMVDLRKPISATKPSYKKQSFAKAKSGGSLDSARGGVYVVAPDGAELRGETDIFAKKYASSDMALLSATESAWSAGSTWNSSQWTGEGFAGLRWAGTAWTGVDWTGRTWAGRTWNGGTWNGRTWADGYWQGRTWAGRTWAGRTWASGGWH